MQNQTQSPQGIKGGVYATLQANFCGATKPRLLCKFANLLRTFQIGRITGLGVFLAFCEGAELAAEGANIGVVDIAIGDITHCLTALFTAQIIGRSAHRVKILAACVEQSTDLLHR